MDQRLASRKHRISVAEIWQGIHQEEASDTLIWGLKERNLPGASLGE